MRLYIYLVCMCASLVGFASLPTQSPLPDHKRFTLTDESPVWDILDYFGKIRLHAIDTVSVKGASVERGKDIVTQGWTMSAEGKRTKKQSKYFTCTACHNTVREFDDLMESNPQIRLEYAVQNKLPFLQAATFFGIVNRETFFNGGYQKKYAHVPEIATARESLRRAIQVCAVEFAKGRALEDWEIESVLMFFWTLELRFKDLKITPDERGKIEYSLREGISVKRAVDIIQEKYLDKTPTATFVEPMAYRSLDSRMENDSKRFANGKLVYELACKHCHAEKRYSTFLLDDLPTTFKNLEKKLQTGAPESIYKIIRHGTYVMGSKRAYMPAYTTERLSNDQLIDLRIYIQKMAKGQE